MTHIRTPIGSVRLAAALFAVCALFTTAGCAPAESDNANEHSAPQDEESIAEQDDIRGKVDDADQSIDKGIQTGYYCCAEKKGNRVKSCFNLYSGYVQASLSCHTTVTDNALRTGTCDKYPSCEGKTTNKPPRVRDPISGEWEPQL